LNQEGQIAASDGNDDPHDWETSPLGLINPECALLRIFVKLMTHGTPGSFKNDEEEKAWWQQLPLVPAVTRVSIRQKNRRRWRPEALAQMITRLPGLREFHYEPWSDLTDEDQRLRDMCEYFPILLQRCLIEESLVLTTARFFFHKRLDVCYRSLPLLV
jgi:hypothetical protein